MARVKDLVGDEQAAGAKDNIAEGGVEDAIAEHGRGRGNVAGARAAIYQAGVHEVGGPDREALHQHAATVNEVPQGLAGTAEGGEVLNADDARVGQGPQPWEIGVSQGQTRGDHELSRRRL